MKTVLLSLLALIAFAGNSVLSRLGLGENLSDDVIDPASFTSIRLASGVVMLFILLALSGPSQSGQQRPLSKGSWLAALSLFLYAALFSYAYLTLDTATGALILFGSVQITMITVGCLRGRRLSAFELAGMCMAIAGFVYLFLPELSKPSLLGFATMSLAGIAWGDYTLRGQGASHPLSTTAYNFLRTLPLVALLLIGLMLTGAETNLSQRGVLLAMASGAITSGIGYAIWYAALNGLSTTQAAVIQLSVPIIAAIGGVMFANELISIRLVLAAALVLGGVLLVILGRAK